MKDKPKVNLADGGLSAFRRRVSLIEGRCRREKEIRKLASTGMFPLKTFLVDSREIRICLTCGHKAYMNNKDKPVHLFGIPRTDLFKHLEICHVKLKDGSRCGCKDCIVWSD